MIVACHLNRSSPVGPAEQELGGSRPRSINSSTHFVKGQEFESVSKKGGGARI